MVLFYFVSPFREETEENNEMSGLSNSLASLILNRLAQDLKDKSSNLRINRIKFCNHRLLSHSFIYLCLVNKTVHVIILYGCRLVIYLKYFEVFAF